MRGQRVIAFVVFALSVTVVADPSRAQDTQYWSLQYGNRADLLGGIVVGSSVDIGASFYNPGALAIIPELSLVLTARAFELENVDLSSGTAPDTNISSLNFSPAPSLFAGSFTFEALGSRKLVYSFLTRQDFDFRLQAVRSGPVDPASNPEGITDVGGELIFDQSLGEFWAGLSWSRLVGEGNGFGFSVYGVYRSQRTRSQILTQGTSDSTQSSTTLIDEISYWHTRLLAKLGYATTIERFKVGVAVTLPSIGLFGSGKIFVNQFSQGLDRDGDSQPDPFLTTDYQDGISPTYKSPFSIALGTSFNMDKTSYHFSCEWFNGVHVYDVLKADPFQSQTTGTVIDPSAQHAQQSIFNFGFGVEHRFSKDFSISGSIVADKTYYDVQSDISVSTWNLWQINTGTTFDVRGTDFTIGLGLSLGAESDIPAGLFQEFGVDSFLASTIASGTVQYTRLRFVVGFSFPTAPTQASGQ
jgi:hypothetical protein